MKRQRLVEPLEWDCEESYTLSQDLSPSTQTTGAQQQPAISGNLLPESVPGVLCDSTRAHEAAVKISKSLSGALPRASIPPECCLKCGEWHIGEVCIARKEEQVNNVMYSAHHCAGCALPL
jgi:hypothetical protein